MSGLLCQFARARCAGRSRPRNSLASALICCAPLEIRLGISSEKGERGEAWCLVEWFGFPAVKCGDGESVVWLFHKHEDDHGWTNQCAPAEESPNISGCVRTRRCAQADASRSSSGPKIHRATGVGLRNPTCPNPLKESGHRFKNERGTFLTAPSSPLDSTLVVPSTEASEPPRLSVGDTGVDQEIRDLKWKPHSGTRFLPGPADLIILELVHQTCINNHKHASTT